LRIVILIFSFLYLFADPVNNSLIILNLKKHTFSISFISFNFDKILNKEASPENIYKYKKDIFNYIESSIKIDNCKLLNPTLSIKHNVYTKIVFNLKCKDVYRIKYNLFFKYDKTHQGILKILGVHDNKNEVVKFDYNHRIFSLKKEKISNLEVVKKFIITGIFHILEGIDHLFFLLMLIIPSALYANSFKKLFIEILKIVTAFTLSHSITLSLSMFNIVYIPERIIETTIALTILFTALLNIRKFMKIKIWKLAFIFGFVHGFGFANSLKDLNLDNNNLLEVVFSFNIGVEIGQIIIVSITLPIIYIISKFNFKIYKKIVFVTSLFTIVLSFLWVIDRWFVLNFMPF